MLRTSRLLKRFWKSQKTVVRNYPYAMPFHHFLTNLPQVQSSMLSNGLTVVTEERNCYNACVGFYFDAGSRYESLFENGIAHFYEHIAFRGTKCRPRPELEEMMNSTGAIFKCFTTREMVVYYVECLCQDVPIVFDILSDCVFNNCLESEEIEYQKQIVFSEMLEHDQDPHKLVNDYLHSSAFQGTPLAQTVMGVSTNLFNFNASTIENYVMRCFDPTRTVVAAVGGICHDQIVRLANAYMCKIEPSKCDDLGGYRYTASEIRYRDDSMPVANVAIAVEAPSFCDPDTPVLDLAKYIVGGWDRSQGGGAKHGTRLARAASTDQLCDSYKAFNYTYKDTGLWGIEFMGNLVHLDDMLANIQDEWMFLCTIVSPGEVERAKHQMKTKLLSKTESCRGNCHSLGRWYLYNGFRPPLHEMIASIDGIYDKHVKEVCSKYIYDKCPVVAAVGPTENLPDYNRIRAGMYWLRL